MRIYLIGYMGSGKTTIGKMVAKEAGLDFLDTDKAIEDKFGLSIADIFSEYGEQSFRKAEDELLMQISQMDNVVIACGGGMSCRRQNIDLIKKSGVSIYLKYEAASLAERLKSESNVRPLLTGKQADELQEFIKHHLESRESFYCQADVNINAEGKSVSVLSDDVLNTIKNFKHGLS